MKTKKPQLQVKHQPSTQHGTRSLGVAAFLSPPQYLRAAQLGMLGSHHAPLAPDKLLGSPVGGDWPSTRATSAGARPGGVGGAASAAETSAAAAAGACGPPRRAMPPFRAQGACMQCESGLTGTKSQALW